MLVPEGDAIAICTMFGGEVVELEGSRDWTIWMRRVRNLRANTVRTFAASMDRFWQWSLFNPVKDDESFTFYLARYRKDLLDGFSLVETVDDERFDDSVKVPVLSVPPLSRQTVNREISGIRSFFQYGEMEHLLDDQRYINYLYEHHRSRRSILSGMQVKKGRLSMELTGARMPFVAPFKTVKDRNRVKYFPPEHFDNLLSVAKPRERLIYLLCGACSARIGQALNLTLYDIDYDRKKVWLIDPKGDEWPDIRWAKRVPRRRWLRESYGIDMGVSGPHNTPDLQFKYPIPLKREALFWIGNGKYTDWFFETLAEYTKSREYAPESARYPVHPFLFVTRSGRRVHARETLARFKRHLRVLVEDRGAPEEILDLGLHSLRHMFGHAMAELYAATGDDILVAVTQNAMGHASLESTLVYFNLSEKTLRELVAKASTEIHGKGAKK